MTWINYNVYSYVILDVFLIYSYYLEVLNKQQNDQEHGLGGSEDREEVWSK